MKGKILSTVGGVYRIYFEDGNILNVTPRGILKHKKITLVVGDDVEVNLENKTIEDIYPRSSYLFRPRISNIDLGIIVSSFKQPDFSSYLIDKFLVLLNKSNIKPLVIITKIDLCEDRNLLEDIKNRYKNLGVDVLFFSKRTLQGLDSIKEYIKNKSISFMGQTGVGKSSLINIIDPQHERKEGEYSFVLGRGKHQTKEVIIFPYEEGFMSDTPGFSSLELDIYKEDLKSYFPFIRDHNDECRYSNCLHHKEPGCKIKELVENKEFDKISYENYLQILDELILYKDRYNR